MLNVVDLFAGVGGLSGGFLRVRSKGQRVYRLACASDSDATAAKTHKRNRPDVPYLVKPIAELTPEEIQSEGGFGKGELHCLLAGLPCQAFSRLGKRNAQLDGWLFGDFLRLAWALQPKVILLENVPHLLTSWNGDFQKHVIDSLRKVGYRVEAATLQASDYGVPQIRRRAFILAAHSDLGVRQIQ
jgi:DNA-cytosine methyltransferase